MLNHIQKSKIVLHNQGKKEPRCGSGQNNSPMGRSCAGGRKKSESLNQLDCFMTHLPVSQGSELKQLIKKFLMLLATHPHKKCSLSTTLMLAPTTKQHFYHCPADKCRALKAQVQYMLDNQNAVLFSSSSATLSLLVGKLDGTPQFWLL